MVVAVVADHPADTSDLRARAQLLAHVLAAARDRLELRALRQAREHLLDLLVDRRREQAEQLGARLLGTEARVRGFRAESGVHRARHLAERAEAGEKRPGVA